MLLLNLISSAASSACFSGWRGKCSTGGPRHVKYTHGEQSSSAAAGRTSPPGAGLGSCTALVVAVGRLCVCDSLHTRDSHQAHPSMVPISPAWAREPHGGWHPDAWGPFGVHHPVGWMPALVRLVPVNNMIGTFKNSGAPRRCCCVSWRPRSSVLLHLRKQKDRTSPRFCQLFILVI